MKTYSTTIPVCPPIYIGPSIAYLTNVPGLAVSNVYKHTFINTILTTTTSGSIILQTTLPFNICDTKNPITNTLITTIQ